MGGGVIETALSRTTHNTYHLMLHYQASPKSGTASTDGRRRWRPTCAATPTRPRAQDACIAAGTRATVRQGAMAGNPSARPAQRPAHGDRAMWDSNEQYWAWTRVHDHPRQALLHERGAQGRFLLHVRLQLRTATGAAPLSPPTPRFPTPTPTPHCTQHWLPASLNVSSVTCSFTVTNYLLTARTSVLLPRPPLDPAEPAGTVRAQCCARQRRRHPVGTALPSTPYHGQVVESSFFHAVPNDERQRADAQRQRAARAAVHSGEGGPKAQAWAAENNPPQRATGAASGRAE